MTKTATDWIAYLEAEPRSEPYLSIAAVLREQATMLQRAHSIISIREAAHPSAKGRAWLAQFENAHELKAKCPHKWEPVENHGLPTGFEMCSECDETRLAELPGHRHKLVRDPFSGISRCECGLSYSEPSAYQKRLAERAKAKPIDVDEIGQPHLKETL